MRFFCVIFFVEFICALIRSNSIYFFVRNEERSFSACIVVANLLWWDDDGSCFHIALSANLICSLISKFFLCTIPLSFSYFSKTCLKSVLSIMSIFSSKLSSVIKHVFSTLSAGMFFLTAIELASAAADIG